MLLKQFKRKSRNYYSAPRFYQKLFDLGVPERYWYVTKNELDFVPIIYEDEYDGKEYDLPPKKQKAFANKLLKSKPGKNTGVVAIGSNPTADMSLAFMFYLAKLLYKKGHRIQIHNMATGTRYVEAVEGLQVLFIYNVNAEDDPRRLQDVRDLLFSTSGVLRVVSFAGDNPLSFFCEKIRYYPNMYFYLLGKYRRLKIED